MEPQIDRTQFPHDEELLLPFERRTFSTTYQEFLRFKRNNTFASIEHLPFQWRRFELMDQIWLREIGDLKRVHAPHHIVVVTLFIRAYARVRLVMELVFAGCATEAADLLRGGIESVAQANKIHHNPELVGVWLNKDSSKAAVETYRGVFERDKKANLFLGLEELHHYWAHFSELGHSSVLTVMGRVETHPADANDIGGDFQFFEVDPERLSKALDTIFDAVFQMERALFQCFDTRLDLDVELGKMRKSLRRMRGKIRPENSRY